MISLSLGRMKAERGSNASLGGSSAHISRPRPSLAKSGARKQKPCAFQNKVNTMNERRLWLNMTTLNIDPVMAQDVSEILRTESSTFSATQKKTRMLSIPPDNT